MPKKPAVTKRLPRKQLVWLGNALRNETTGGVLLLAAAIAALIWANLDFSGYSSLRDLKFGFDEIHLKLSLGKWAADGLLAIFFFVAGMELKHELVEGSLKDRAVAVVPVAAAIGGMAVPALIYMGFNLGQESVSGWGIPMATDIAFALAVLAVAGRNLPIELRAFLLTLAVVDDLGAIIVIAVFYTSTINYVYLGLALLGLASFGLMQRRQVQGWYYYLPLACFSWWALHQSGIHATIAGVAMGLMMNLKTADRVLQRVHPISAGLAVPVFAFFTAGVFVGGIDVSSIASSPVVLGVVLGLVIGKPIGVVGAAWLVTRFSRAGLSKSLGWWDVCTVGLLAGVGFTVSLLINELAFSGQEEISSVGTLAVLVASTISAALAIIALQFRKRAYSND